MSFLDQNKCLHCSGVPTNHRFEYITVKTDLFFEKYLFPLEILRKKIKKLFVTDRTQKVIFLLLRFGFRDGSLKFLNNRERVIFESAKSLGINISRFYLFSVPTQLFFAKKEEKQILYFTMPRPRKTSIDSLDWMDDKELLRQKFVSKAFPVPNGGVAKKWNEAIVLFKNLNSSVVVKPIRSSRGRHTHTNIDNLIDLKKAFDIAKQISPIVVIENYLEGDVFRATLLDKKVFAVIRKDYPAVFGDGYSTVLELINKENQNPKRSAGIFKPLLYDIYSENELKKQNLSLQSIPEKGRKVNLYNKPGRQLGSTNEDVTDLVNLENIKLFEKIGEYLDNPLVGVDFISKDIAKPWYENGAGIIECNSLPFIDIHHNPYVGMPRDAVGELWRLVFGLERST